ncbi:MAG: hypothetical protein Fur0043_03030 [Anaerolineales bacterium]
MKRSTWIVLILFLALLGVMLYLDKTKTTSETATGTPTLPPEKLLSEADGAITAIELSDGEGQSVRLVKDGGQWRLEKPVETEANQGSAEEAAAQLTALRILSKPGVAPADVGLISPSYSLLVTTARGAKKEIYVGDATPSGSGYYAQEAGSQAVIVLEKNGVDALKNLLTAPPYLNTPTPSPTPVPPTETPTPLPTAEQLDETPPAPSATP